jgi:hypothetical protein
VARGHFDGSGCGSRHVQPSIGEGSIQHPRSVRWSQVSATPIPEPTTTCYLARHCDVANPEGVLYGHLPNFPLSAKGRLQATMMGRYLAEAGVRAIYASPLERAQETALVLAAELSPAPPLLTRNGLVEAEFGRYLQGTRYKDVVWRKPRWWVHMVWPGVVPGDESMAAMAARSAADGIVVLVGDALLQGDDRVVGDVDAFRADLGAALGDVAVAEAELLEGEPPAVQGVERMHLELGQAHDEARAGEVGLVLLVFADDVADVLAEEAFDALAELLDAVDIDLLPCGGAVGLILEAGVNSGLMAGTA